tara:strand:+ start:586 stop:777 length:192 start_codon:yes stop_codon:yes gene_type:complete
MTQLYLLKWTSLVTGETGTGKAAFNNLNTANYYKNTTFTENVVYSVVKAPPGTPVLKINNIYA